MQYVALAAKCITKHYKSIKGIKSMEWINNDYFKVVQFVLTSIFTVIAFVLVLFFVKRSEHDALKERVKSIEDTYNTSTEHVKLAKQVNTLETQLAALPNSREIHSLEKEVGELKGSVDGMKDLLSNINNHVNMLVENEIKG
jgi:hypothetical protein